VSLTECERGSTAKNTFTANATASVTHTTPGTTSGGA